ncbi:PEP-CTERM sorting domain-containing protein [Planktothrix sp. FACHB-1355]|uniref:PEP-CTERM sorting domain-containing protein n=1 Tax=Aerosakkonema funiforme FACHB-1375 TaxID=2949571 RepID=A0A926VLV5_9CYAN|nr:PEP-CTERM sorting domain-containing protein [Aerosakkonema funiforme FACHB-1375]MBD3562819.1 PEP-CTERM sorting domain-containing protein [Planktothrix sp. FACHB-1355]
MSLRNVKTLLGTAAAAACLFSVTGQQANAATLSPNWSYTIDSFNDGADLYKVGSKSSYELYGMAMKEENGKVFVAINANLALTGQAEPTHPEVQDGNVGWGDLFFNFSGLSFKDASAQEKLFGIRFAGTNDSGAATTGLYSGVKAKSVGFENYSYSRFSKYQNWVENTATDSNGQHGKVGFGDLTAAEAKDYLTKKNGVVEDTSYSIQNVIATGNKVGDIQALSAGELASLNFAQYSATGSQTFGFKFDRSLLPSGDALISLLEECINDGIAVKVTLADNEPPTSIPEPSAVASLTLLGLGLFGTQMRRRAYPTVKVAK